MTNITCDIPASLGDFGTMMPNMTDMMTDNIQNALPSGLGCILDGKGVIRKLNFDENNVTRNFIALSVLLIGFRVLAFVCLNLRARLLR